MSDVEATEVRGLDLLDACQKKRKHRSRGPKKSKNLIENNHKTVKKDKDEVDLEDIVFGGNLRDSDSEDEVNNKRSRNVERSTGTSDDSSEGMGIATCEESETEVRETEEQAAWDDDDDYLTVEEGGGAMEADKTMASFLREKHEKIFARPQWAVKAEKKVRDDEPDMLLRKASSYIDRTYTGRPLASGSLDFTRCPQMNKFCFQRSSLSSLAFHPSSEIAMLAHRNGAVTFVSVSSKECSKIQTVYLKDFEISCAELSHNGMQMMCGSARYRTLHCYDLMSGTWSQVTFPKAHELTHMRKFRVSSDGRFIAIHGRFGIIYIICAETKQQIATLKMNEEVSAVSFSKDGKMFSHGGNYVYLWDIAARRCVHKFLDEGCLKGRAMALSEDENLLATGCDSGIVNIYDASKLRSEALRTPKPLKCVKNLLTPVTTLEFNPSSEALLMASSYKPEAVKMLHVGSQTVFSNFPNAQHKFHSITCAAFSINGGFLSLGTSLGAANLVRLKHFGSY